MSESNANPNEPTVKPYRIEEARIVGGEYRVKLAILTEYDLTVVAGHYDEDAVEVAEELALFGDNVKIADRDLVHSNVEQLREVFEDDVEAGEIEWIEEPSAPSPDTFWDDTKHFETEPSTTNIDEGDADA